MITLYTFGPAFGLPEPSPFVTKVEVLLKMAGLPYRTDTAGFRQAPKGKLPYIDDDGERVADSTFIRWHLENKYRIDFEKGLSPEQRAVAWAFEKMAEDNLYWALVDARWVDDANFAKVPGYEFSFWTRVGAPRNTPAEIVDKLNTEINAALADPKMKARLAEWGATALPGSPADFGKLIADETEKWGKVIRAANIKAE